MRENGVMDSTNGSSQLNGSSGFISYEEQSSFEKSYTETTETTVEYSLQNERNHRLASLRRRIVAGSEPQTPENRLSRSFQERRPKTDPRAALQAFTPERLEKAGRSVNFYKQYGDFWNTFPKTDYTYSESSPWYGDEVAPGIRRIPNMSRRTFRSRNSTVTSVPTPPSSQSSEYATRLHWSASSSSSVVLEESWFAYVKRVVRTTTTTVVNTLYTSVFQRRANAGTPAGRTKWFIWPLLILLFCLVYYWMFGSGEPSQDAVVIPVLDRASSAAHHFATTVWKPFGALWTLAVSFVTLFFNSIVVLPNLFVHVNETAIISSEFSQSQMTWLMETIRDIVESMDPHDFRVSPEDEERIVDRVNKGVSKQIQELRDGLEALKAEQTGQFATSQQHQGRLNALQISLAKMQEEINNVKEDAGRSNVVASETNAGFPMDFRAAVMAITEEMLEKYHADRTGKTDYALLSNGGAIASIRCTRPYKEGTGEYVLWDMFVLGEYTNSPDVILKPGIMPGECWAFEGANGYLAIRLSLPIYVDGFTMEHTPRELSPFGHIQSAPRKFSVWGLETLEDREETFLGSFEFLDNGKSLQSYDAVKVDRPFHLVELRIESNHGHLEYTCLYRFRVHGRPASGPN